MAEADEVLTNSSLDSLPKIAEGKVRDLYEVDSKTLLFVASDRVSAYDVIMGNVRNPRIHTLHAN
jgi:phosphoribosylaminoimidazole-succinocarboxamide synthase